MSSLMTFLALIVLAWVHLLTQSSAATTHTQTGKGEILAAGDHHETGKLVVRRRSTLDLNRKETYDNTRFMGRKPVLKRILLAMGKAEVEYLNGGQFCKSSTTSSGSSSSRNRMNMKNVGPQRLRNISSSRAHRRVKEKTFIPLNADYHVPKPHPPKNN